MLYLPPSFELIIIIQAEKADINNVKNPFKGTHKHTVCSTIPVSLSPPQQSALYNELELIILSTANKFLMLQYAENRMSVESVKIVTEYWRGKGRPQVIEFQYDQATQRDLIVANQKTFRFHGEKAGNALQISGMLYNWKENAREMSIRTFCAPDSVIQKQLHDTYKILELLGAEVVTFLALQEIHAAFTRQVQRAKEIRNAKASVSCGVERVWIPPSERSSLGTRERATYSSHGSRSLGNRYSNDSRNQFME